MVWKPHRFCVQPFDVSFVCFSRCCHGSEAVWITSGFCLMEGNGIKIAQDREGGALIVKQAFPCVCASSSALQEQPCPEVFCVDRLLLAHSLHGSPVLHILGLKILEWLSAFLASCLLTDLAAGSPSLPPALSRGFPSHRSLSDGCLLVSLPGSLPGHLRCDLPPPRPSSWSILLFGSFLFSHIYSSF